MAWREPLWIAWVMLYQLCSLRASVVALGGSSWMCLGSQSLGLLQPRASRSRAAELQLLNGST